MSPEFRRDVLTMMSRLVDLAAVSVSFVVSFAISSGSFTWPDLTNLLVMRIKVINILIFTGYLLLCSATFSACGLYRSHRLSRWRQRLYEKLLAASIVAAIFLMIKRFFAIWFATADFLLWYWLLTICVLVLSHEITQGFLHLVRLRGRNLRRVVVIGEEPDASALAERIGRETSLGYRVLRIIDAREIGENGPVIGDR